MVRGKEGAAGCWPWCAQRQGRVALYSGTDELVLFDGALHCSAGRSKRRGAAPGGTWCGKVTIWERARGNLWLQGHILASLATLTATADQQRDGRWEIGEEEGLDSRKSFCLISVRAAPGPRRSQGRSTPAMRQKY